MKKTVLFLPLLLGLLASCSTKTTSFSVLKPAELTFPQHIAKLALLDRSKPAKGWANVLEGILSGEEIGQDKRSREEAMSGLTNALTRTPRFQVRQTGIEMTGTSTGMTMPQPLPWPLVERICGDHSSDALVAIESFDTDATVNTSKSESKTKDKDGKEVVTVTWTARLRQTVHMGWRVYDPKTKTLVDEFTTNDDAERSATGNTEQAARTNLPSQTTVSRDIAQLGGQHYGSRIAPVYQQVQREFYKSAKDFKDEMKRASRMAESGDWANAERIWQKIATNKNSKAAPRAAHNLAVAAEVQGNVEEALKRAQSAYAQYGKSREKTYAQTLQNRLNDDRRAAEQMKKKV